MIRLIIAGFMVLMAGNTNSASNESIYKSCKKFTDSGFNESTKDAIACTMYFVGVRDAYYSACEIYKVNFGALSEDEKFVLEFFALEAKTNIHSSIQDYVNRIQQKPEDWQYMASSDVAKSLRKMAPCKPE